MELLSLSELKSYLFTAKALAYEGGNALLEYWGNVHKIHDKDQAGNLVTEADQESEKRILARLKSEYPEHSILAEESGAKEGMNSDFLWVIDPLDGTTNYAHGYPMISVSVALVFKGNPVIGVVWNPIMEELFVAVEGEGAFLNDKKISVSTTKTLAKSLLASGFAYDRRETSDNNYAEFCHLTDLTQGVRRGGSAALDMAYVAAGRFDGYWERGIQPWDIAAGWVLVKEAGGTVSAYDGSKPDLFSGRILATNGLIHRELSTSL